MKKACLFFIFVFALVIFNFANAKENDNLFIPEQWFLQVGSFTSVENAIAFQQSTQSKIDEIYSLDREFTNYVTVHPHATNYRVLIGAYPTKKDAQTARSRISEKFSNIGIIKLQVNRYFNYPYGYELIWNRIDKPTYDSLLKESVSFLNLRNFKLPSLNKKVSLVAHTQIKEEIFDFKKTQTLLEKNGFLLKLKHPDNLWVAGYEAHGKATSTNWPFIFYAYYPSEKLIVFWGEGESLVGLSTDTGEFTWKLPYSILYSPDKNLRISGESFGELGGGRSFVEAYNTQLNHFVDLMDIGIVSPWFLNKTTSEFAWLSDNKAIFILQETLPAGDRFKTDTRYYQVTIVRIPSSGDERSNEQ